MSATASSTTSRYSAGIDPARGLTMHDALRNYADHRERRSAANAGRALCHTGSDILGRDPQRHCHRCRDPMTGWMVARWGHRNVLLWSIIGFSITSVLCALADTLVPLLIYRVGQGTFGAPLVPLAQAIIVAVYPPERRAFAQGIFGIAVVIGPAIAPALGGYLSEAYNWRMVFLLILPLCAATFIAVWLWVHDTNERHPTSLNWTGFLALSIAVTCGQLMMDRGERLDWWDHLKS